MTRAPEISSDRTPIADVPIGSLGDGPLYHRPMEPSADRVVRAAADPGPVLAAEFPAGTDLSDEFLALLERPNIADKSWAWRQYDHQLFLNTVVGPGGDAAVLRLKETRGRALALSVDGSARFCALDPRTGGRLVVLEAARNVACAGARPLALVNCLNFGNPEHPDVMWQFSETVTGMSEACTALGIPVIGGNVSFYNESRGADIDPTPVVGVVGLVDDLTSVPPGLALRDGDRIMLLGETRPELGGSEWATAHGHRDGVPPVAELEEARRLHELVAALVHERIVGGVHDCADGGVAVALAEMAFAGHTGFRVEIGDALGMLLRVRVPGAALGRARPGGARAGARPGGPGAGHRARCCRRRCAGGGRRVLGEPRGGRVPLARRHPRPHGRGDSGRVTPSTRA